MLPISLLSEKEITDLIEEGLVVEYTDKNDYKSDSLYVQDLYFDNNKDSILNDDHINMSIIDNLPYYEKKNKVVKIRMKVTEKLLETINGNMIYKVNHWAAPENYYLSLITRNDGSRALYVKYQSIIGHRKLGDLTDAHVNQIQKKAGEEFNKLFSKYSNKNEQAIDFEYQENLKGKPVERILPILKEIEYTDLDFKEIRIMGQVNSKDYAVIKSIFEDLGGKWNRKKGLHIFDESPVDKINEIIETGKYVKDYNYGYFPTPPELTSKVIIPAIEANYFDGMRVLEPSIGQGHMADEIVKTFPGVDLVGIEINQKNYDVSSSKHKVILGDFLDQDPQAEFDVVAMNPPFEKSQDVEHVNHAMKFLKPGGLLVAIMSSGVTFRSDKKTSEFRDMVDSLGGTITENPEKSFSSSGTQVNTVCVQFRTKPKLKMKM